MLTYGIYLVTDMDMIAGHGHTLQEVVSAAVAGGVGCIQVRAKNTSARDFLNQLRITCDVSGNVPVLVNDRVDVYCAARHLGIPVAGVHIGQDDIPPRAARAMLEPGAILGLSANLPEHFEALAGLEKVVDYVGCGPINHTTTKVRVKEPRGAHGFAELTQRTTLPAVAIGGVTQADVHSLRAVGAAGAAVVSAICAARHPSQATTELVSAWNHAGDAAEGKNATS